VAEIVADQLTTEGLRLCRVVCLAFKNDNSDFYNRVL
jgi:hypothetical protein